MVIENKSYTIAETVLSYPIAYITRVLQMLMDGKETPPSFFERAASNPADYLGKGFLNYKHKNNVPSSIHLFLSERWRYPEFGKDATQHSILE
jgi:hypothetical protein